MAKAKVAVTVDATLLQRVDELVSAGRFVNRSQAFEIALAGTVARLMRTRLAREAARLDPEHERRLADRALPGMVDTWPEY
jgi:metal-responsive CopG/Arc/MetJ family transcriptional regulator